MAGTHSDLPVWLQWIQAIAVPILGFVAGWIAYQQWKTADRKVQLDLFDRRFELYDKVRDALFPIVREGGATMQDLHAYADAIDKSSFLLGDEVVARFTETRMHISNLIMWTDAMKSGPPYPSDAVKGKHECFPKIVALLNDMPMLFKPYMKIDQKVRPDLMTRLLTLRNRKR